MEKVALIAVHGVADQKAGDTAKAVVDLLVASSDQVVRYSSEHKQDLALPVAPLKPYVAAPHRGSPSPIASDRSLLKSVVQSYKSDFQLTDRPASDFKATQRTIDTKPRSIERDRGLDLTDYLLGKQIDNHGAQEVYETTRIDLDRRTSAEQSAVHVFEMYWADLSRLSGAVPRVIAEFSTLIFRLSRLGRDTVAEARGSLGVSQDRPRRWALLSRLQTLLDWLFVNVLAQLFAQLLIFGIFIMLLGFLIATPIEGRDLAAVQSAFDLRFCRVLSIGFAALGVLLFMYRRKAPRRTLVVPLLLIAAALPLGFSTSYRAAVASVMMFALLTLAYNWMLKTADERFPLTRFSGLTIWAAMCTLVAYNMWDELTSVTGFAAWRHSALYGVELALLCIKVFWFIASMLLVLWLGAGVVAQTGGGVEARSSVSTGRLGLGVSFCSFVALTMALWALLTTALNLSVAGVDYEPRIFVASMEQEIQRAESKAQTKKAVREETCTGEWGVAAVARPAAAASVPLSGAQAFLDQRYKASTEAFAPTAVLLLALIGFLVVTLTPSILAEVLVFREPGPKSSNLKASSGSSHKADSEEKEALGESRAFQLGRWLTGGYRQLDRFVLVVCAFGVGLAAVVFYVFAGGDWIPEGLQRLAGCYRPSIAGASQTWLTPFVIGAASVGAAFTVLGGLLSKYVPALRAPLDTALDVDNFFREFPRTQIPRARIFARYVALLEHIAAQGYTKVVIVAHSQGCVISAETLRWLTYGKQQPDGISTEARKTLYAQMDADLRILTLGNPLRQLYAARFPTLYRWVLARKPNAYGPEARDIGVRQWLNAFTSGDYVGRWLWTRDAASKDVLAHPLSDSINPAFLGRAAAYDGFPTNPPDAVVLDGAAEAETCLGVGAHTHYLEMNQGNVAWLVNYLISSKASPQQLQK